MVRGIPRAVLGALIAVVAAYAAASPAFAAEEDAVRIRQVNVRAFPRVAVTVQLGNEGAADEIVVAEDGHRRRVLGIQPLAESGRNLDVVLAIDTSNSMRGEQLATALQAARDFLAKLPSGVSVGVVTFAHSTRLVQPISADREAAAAAIDSIDGTEKGTTLYDAIVASARQFSGAAQHNIVIVSDGADTESTASAADAVETARKSGATVFSIGLAENARSTAALEQLASRTGGAYASAFNRDLSAVYERLATGLSHQYVLTFRSHSPRGAQVLVRVAVHGGSDTAFVLMPHSSATAVPGQTWRELLALRGPVGLAVVLVLSFLTVFFAMLALLRTQVRARRQRYLAQRISTAGLKEEVAAEDERGLVGLLPQPIVDAAERVAKASGFAPKIDWKLERAGFPLRSGEFVAASFAATLLGILVGVVLFGQIPFIALFALVGALGPYAFLNFAMGRRLRELHGQLAETLMVLASSLRAGHSFMNALDMISREIAEPAAGEFRRVLAEARLGRPLDEAMNAMADRIASEDFHWAVLAVNIQREVGGNLAEILDTVAETLRERDQLRRQIRVLSAEGRLSVYILAALPFVLGLYIAKVNPGYLSPLFNSTGGLMMTIGAGVLMLIGFVWMRKIVTINV